MNRRHLDATLVLAVLATRLAGSLELAIGVAAFSVVASTALFVWWRWSDVDVGATRAMFPHDRVPDPRVLRAVIAV